MTSPSKLTSCAVADTLPSSGFHQDVLRTLCSVVGGSQFIKRNSYTPYFYKLGTVCASSLPFNYPAAAAAFKDFNSQAINFVNLHVLYAVKIIIY